MHNGRPALGAGAAEAFLAAQPLARSALGAGAAGAYNKRNIDLMAEAEAARNVRHRPDEHEELPFSPIAIAPVLPFSPFLLRKKLLPRNHVCTSWMPSSIKFVVKKKIMKSPWLGRNNLGD